MCAYNLKKYTQILMDLFWMRNLAFEQTKNEILPPRKSSSLPLLPLLSSKRNLRNECQCKETMHLVEWDKRVIFMLIWLYVVHFWHSYTQLHCFLFLFLSLSLALTHSFRLYLEWVSLSLPHSVRQITGTLLSSVVLSYSDDVYSVQM
jgi:hypothetical protein